MNVLKPCPFCGGEAIHFYDKKAKGHVIMCGNGTECWIGPRTGLYTELETAIEAWNWRITDDN